MPRVKNNLPPPRHPEDPSGDVVVLDQLPEGYRRERIRETFIDRTVEDMDALVECTDDEVEVPEAIKLLKTLTNSLSLKGVLPIMEGYRCSENQAKDFLVRRETWAETFRDSRRKVFRSIYEEEIPKEEKSTKGNLVVMYGGKQHVRDTGIRNMERAAEVVEALIEATKLDDNDHFLAVFDHLELVVGLNEDLKEQNKPIARILQARLVCEIASKLRLAGDKDAKSKAESKLKEINDNFNLGVDVNLVVRDSVDDESSDDKPFRPVVIDSRLTVGGGSSINDPTKGLKNQSKRERRTNRRASSRFSVKLLKNK